jgi:hypothetical protein
LNPLNNSINNKKYPNIQWECNYYNTEVLFTLKIGRTPDSMTIIKTNMTETELDMELNKELYFMEYDTDYYYQVL